MKWKKEFDKVLADLAEPVELLKDLGGYLPLAIPMEGGRYIPELKQAVSKLLKQQRETILPKLRHIKASIPLTGGMTARKMAKQLIEELENE